jgi:flagellar biosynthetic protein FliR
MISPAAALASLPDWAFAFMLVLARVGTACMLLPGIGEAEMPGTLRVIFAVVLSGLLLPVLSPLIPPAPSGVAELAFMLVAEIFTGLWLGWLTRLILLALPMAGQLMATAIGMSNVLQPDAMLGASAAALSRLLGLAAPLLILASGLHGLALQAVAGSYQLIKPGTFLPIGDSVAFLVDAVGQAFGLALRLAAPLLMASLLVHLSLGLAGRLVPHLQIYFAGLPAQILVGIGVFAVLAGAILNTWMDTARTVFDALPGL